MHVNANTNKISEKNPHYAFITLTTPLLWPGPVVNLQVNCP